MKIDKPLNVLILDDELHACELLEIYLQKHCPAVNEITKALSVSEARKYLLKKRNINVLFIDIEMPDENGLEFVQSIDLSDIYPVFVTSHAQYSIAALKANAFDYLLKPVRTEELKETIERICSNRNSNIKNENPHQPIQRFEIRNQKQISYIDHQDIIMITAQGSYSEVHTLEGKHLISQNLRQIESTLNNRDFFRCHNSYLVNIRHVKQLIHEGNYVMLTKELKSIVSKSKREEFMHMMLGKDGDTKFNRSI